MTSWAISRQEMNFYSSRDVPLYRGQAGSDILQWSASPSGGQLCTTMSEPDSSGRSVNAEPLRTPDGRYLVINGSAGPRLWRASNPTLRLTMLVRRCFVGKTALLHHAACRDRAIVQAAQVLPAAVQHEPLPAALLTHVE